jgi:hypothetical protein
MTAGLYKHVRGACDVRSHDGGGRCGVTMTAGQLLVTEPIRCMWFGSTEREMNRIIAGYLNLVT